MRLEIPSLMGPTVAHDTRAWTIGRADPRETADYRALRREVFVAEQRVLDVDHDDRDDDPRTIVLVARSADGRVLGGVRLAPATPGRDIGWWTGSRLVVRRDARQSGGIGPALVREACATALRMGVLRFEATVQEPNEVLFRRLGWTAWGATRIQGTPHVRMRWPITRIRDLVAATKSELGSLVGDLRQDSPFALGGAEFLGDDGAPVPGTDVVAACDAILPALVDRDPEWAGWCAVLVNVNDLAAMGALPVGLLDAIGAPSPEIARRVVGGIRSAAQAWGVPVLGGHTQIGVPSALTVTALGRTDAPVPGGGARRGDDISLTVDLHGRWRPGFEGRQWDSTSTRTGADLRALGSLVAGARPAAAKDVSMAGIVGTAAMLAEASAVGATLEPDSIPAPDGVPFGDWLTCFPGFAMLTADRPGQERMTSPIARTARIGTATAEPGVRLLWPDGVETDAACPTATGLLPG